MLQQTGTSIRPPPERKDPECLMENHSLSPPKHTRAAVTSIYWLDYTASQNHWTNRANAVKKNPFGNSFPFHVKCIRVALAGCYKAKYFSAFIFLSVQFRQRSVSLISSSRVTVALHRDLKLPWLKKKPHHSCLFTL